MARVILAFVLALAAAAQLPAQLERTIHFHTVSIAPDGSRTAWGESAAGQWPPRIHVLENSGKGQDTALNVGAEPAWSPNSKMLAYFAAEDGKDQQQLWTVSASGTGARKRTEVKGYVAAPRWSPDGKRIAFLFVEDGGGGGPLLAAAPRTGVIGQEIHNQRIAVVELSSGKLEMASPANLHVYDYAWAPDSGGMIATAAPGPGDNNWWIAELFVMRRGAAKSIYKPRLQLATPRYSPDGKVIAFIEGLMSDEGFHGGDLFTIPAEGGQAVNRTPERKSSPSAIFWTANDRIVFTEHINGGSAVSELTLGGGTRTLWQGGEGMHAFGNFPNFSFAPAAGVSAAVRSNYGTPPEVWVGPPGKWRKATSKNAEQKVEWGKAESLDWTNEGFRIQGWLLGPKVVEEGRRYPMIVLIHGGPAGQETSVWPNATGLQVALSQKGYYVFMPNPRGSYGQGEKFTEGNVKDFGGGDLRDVMAGVDEVVRRYPVDPNRLGLTGWSYGGYMTMWAVTQTKRFRVAVAGAGIANWQSYYGQNLIDRWMIPFFGASVYDDPAVYEKSSPIRYIKAVKTPTLVLVGERDAECPAPQSFEFWHALRTLGVPTELVIYPGEGHMIVDNKNRLDVQQRALAWFEKYLK